MYEKTQVELQIYTDQEEMLDQIVNSYDLPDKSKAVRCLLDYVEENRDSWNDMFETIRCKHC